ncbi:hypothetical protein NQ317_005681 [Molorchus minor]|uniref:Uncharacterized protein n=1 Tax=Molorchus minor TaxID=1323400 RepID=A0ABQ9J8R3_9CUCU|nr:hypothetical protein NQ317_005681 [Molorchus minor]
MDDGASTKKRHSFSGKLWKQLKPSKNKQKAKSFVSYSNESDDESGAKKDQDLYYYYGCIKISNLSVDPPGHKDTKIILKDFVNSRLSKHLIEYKLEAASDKIQNSWRDALHKCLWLELVNAKSR